MVRFFVSPSDISERLIKLSAEDTAHIRSLRLRPSEFFVACDGKGNDYLCRLEETGRGGQGTGDGDSFAGIVERRPSVGEPSVRCSVYIALAKGERLDYAVQKSVELGAHDITLFLSGRCISVPKDITKKTARLQKIALETAKQCGRGIVPEITAASSFKMAIELAAKADLALLPYECEDKISLKQVLCQGKGQMAYKTISIMTGPEGGFEPHEALLAEASGMISVSLGPRVLRCETAPAAVLAAIMYHTDNMSL